MRCFLIFLTSLIVVLSTTPAIIKVTRKSRMLDDPSDVRKIHKLITPNSGGIAIFLGFLFSCLIFIPSILLPQANVLMAAAMIVFVMGLKDDIDDLVPYKKFVAQFVAAVLVTVAADVRIVSLGGILGVYELPYQISIVVSIIAFVGLVNAFNLIDGIDGLAGSIGVVISVFYTFLFFEVSQFGYAYLSISLAGALIGFLWFNFTPSKIFMGDSGSLLLGFIAAVLSMRLTGTDIMDRLTLGPLHITSAPALIIAALIVPVFDTLRIFSVRILEGKSPFKADNNHSHHRLLLLGLSHVQATSILVAVNVTFISLILLLQSLGNTILIAVITICIFGLNLLLSKLINHYKKFELQSKKHILN